MAAERIERLAEGDEVAGNHLRALVDELVERVLPVGTGLAPVDRTGLIVDGGAVEGDVLAVRLHRQLLEVSGEALEILLVGKHGDGLGAEELVVPERQQTHQRRQVALERGGAEMLVHGVEAGEHGAEVLGADGEHGR
jgi:hypothetical protein